MRTSILKYLENLSHVHFIVQFFLRKGSTSKHGLFRNDDTYK